MPTFEYKATTLDGNILTGQRDGQNEETIVLWLQEANYIPIHIQQVNDKTSVVKSFSLINSKRLTKDQELEFTEQLSTLVKSKLPLDQALKILEKISTHKNVKSLVTNLLERVESGSEFSAALEAQKQFSPFYINMVRASEASGNLDTGLIQLYHYLDNVKNMRDKLKSALLYPLILLIVAGLSIVMILLFVVPKITELFVGSDQALPLPTQVVISFSQAVVNYWWLLPIAIISIIYYVSYVSASNNKHKLFWHGVSLRIPLLKDLIIRAETAKFANSLSTLISNGVNMQSALPIANATLTNMVFSNNLQYAIEGFKEGKSLHGIMSKVDHFPVLATQMINVGEETGELESMLARIAEIYEREVSNAMQRFLSLLEPLLIVSLGLIIGGIIISILMAIMSVNDLSF